MGKRHFILRSILGVMIVPGLFGASAKADSPLAEPAVAIRSDAETLSWGPCPAFLPEGCGIAVLHGDPARANVDILFRVPAGSKIAPHWHTSAERIVLVAGQMQVTYEGQDTVVLTPGTYAYGPARRPHHATCDSATPCVLFIAFESPLDAVPIENKDR